MRELSPLGFVFVIVMLAAAPLCALAADDEQPKEPPVSSLVIHNEDEYIVRRPGEIVRVASGRVHLIDTNYETGYETTITGKRGVLWISDITVEGPTGPEKKQRVEIFVEGDVIIIQKTIATGVESKAYCKQLYFDMYNRKGVLLDAWLKVYDPGQKINLYITAQKVREFGTGDPTKSRLKIYKARVTNDEYGKPVMYVDLPTLDVEGKTVYMPARRMSLKVTNITAYHSMVKVRGVPIFYLPFAAGSTMNNFFLRSIRVGHSSRYGTFVLTRWDLQRMGLLDNDWDKLRLSVDYYSKRGPGVGFEYEYKRPDYFGILSGYFVKDSGMDRAGSKRFEPSTDDRGRIKLMHRHFLGDGWVGDLEVAKISDRGFMNEFMERELEDDKDQESLLYLHRTWEHYMFTAIGKTEVNNFLTSTEYLPQVGFNVVSIPIWGDRLYFSLHTEAAELRRHYQNHLPFHDVRMTRGDINTELAAPFGLSIFQVRPYVGLRGTFYEGIATQGSEQRFTAYAGVQTSTHFSKVFYDAGGKPVMRHIILPWMEIYSAAVNTTDPEDLVQFDTVDIVDRLTVFRLGVRQIFQTKRGPVDNRRSFDTLTVDLEVNLYSDYDPIGFYFDPSTGENVFTGSPFGQEINDNFKIDALWRVNERLEVFGNATVNFDTSHIDIYEAGFRWYPSDVVSLALRNYFFRNDGHSTFASFTNIFQYNNALENVVFPYDLVDADDNNNVLELDFGYQASEKWAFGVFVRFDMAGGGSNNVNFIIRRYFHVWVMDVTFERDSGAGDTRISLSFSPRALTSSFVKKFQEIENGAIATGAETPKRYGR